MFFPVFQKSSTCFGSDTVPYPKTMSISRMKAWAGPGMRTLVESVKAWCQNSGLLYGQELMQEPQSPPFSVQNLKHFFESLCHFKVPGLLLQA